LSEPAPIAASLKKIGIAIEAGTSPDRMDITGSPKNEEFIFGIATDGLTPFEAQLYGKAPGQAASFALKAEEVPPFMGHLCRLAPDIAIKSQPVFFQVTVLTVRPAENREVVRAMAELSACGEGCCGNH
jgi:hypothetical protein